MSFILKLFTRSTPPDYSGTPMRTESPVRNIPEQQKPAAIELFRKFYAHHYPHAENYHSLVLKESCTFEQMLDYFEGNIDGWNNDPVAERIEIDVLNSLDRATQTDERKAYEQLQLVVNKFAAHNTPEAQIKDLLENYQNNPKGIQKNFPELPRLLFEYQRARAVYDVAVNQWATSYLQTHSTSNKKTSLLSRVTEELKAATPCWLLSLFGYNKTKLKMLEFRKRTISQQSTQIESTEKVVAKPPLVPRHPIINYWIDFPRNQSERDIVFLFKALVGSKLPNIDIRCDSIQDIRAIMDGSLDGYGLGHQVGLLYLEFKDLLKEEEDLPAAAQTIQMYDHPWQVEIDEEHTPMALEIFNEIANTQDLAIQISSKEQLLTYLENPQLISSSSIVRARVIKQFQTKMGAEARFSPRLPHPVPEQQQAPKEKKSIRWSDESSKPLATWKEIPFSEDGSSRVTEERFKRGPLHPRETGRKYSESDRSRWKYEGNLDLYPSFTTLASDTASLEKEEQSYAIFKLDLLRKKFFGETFPKIFTAMQAENFLLKLIEVEGLKEEKDAFATAFRKELDATMVMQRERLKRETEYDLTAR